MTAKTRGAGKAQASEADKAAGTAVEKAKAAGLPAEFDYGEQTNYNTYSSADLVIPAISVLQGLSLAVTKKVGEGGVKGARPGMLHMSVTDELFDGEEGVGFIPIYVYQDFVEWIPRDKGGGIVGRYPVGSKFVIDALAEHGSKFGKIPLGNIDAKGIPDRELVDTKYLYGRLLRDGVAGELIVLRFSSSKIPVWSNLLYKLDQFVLKDANGNRIASGKQIPKWAHQLRLRTQSQSNKKGDFYNFMFQPLIDDDTKESLLPSTSPLMAENKAIADNIHRQRETLVIEGADDHAQGEGGEEIPF